MTLQDLQADKEGVTHMISEVDPGVMTMRAKDWRVMNVVSGFERWQVEFGRSPLRMEMREKLWILERVRAR